MNSPRLGIRTVCRTLERYCLSSNRAEPSPLAKQNGVDAGHFGQSGDCVFGTLVNFGFLKFRMRDGDDELDALARISGTYVLATSTMLRVTILPARLALSHCMIWGGTNPMTPTLMATPDADVRPKKILKHQATLSFVGRSMSQHAFETRGQIGLLLELIKSAGHDDLQQIEPVSKCRVAFKQQ